MPLFQVRGNVFEIRCGDLEIPCSCVVFTLIDEAWYGGGVVLSCVHVIIPGTGVDHAEAS